MVIESTSCLKHSSAEPRLTVGANLFFLAIFAILTATLTPLTIYAVNRNTKIALLSPIPSANDPLPPIKENSVVVAAPATESGETQDNTQTESNSTGNSFIFPAGTTEIDIYNPKASGQSYIYLIPKTKTNSVVSVKNKSAGKFTATISPAEVTDLTIDYLLINQ